MQPPEQEKETAKMLGPNHKFSDDSDDPMIKQDKSAVSRRKPRKVDNLTFFLIFLLTIKMSE